MADISDKEQIILERARRLRAIRSYLNLSRADFAKVCNFEATEGTLRNWEQGRLNGLTENGAQIISRNLKKLGINCTVEWLLFGFGKNLFEPMQATSRDEIQNQTSELFISDKITFSQENQSSKSIIAAELKLFHQLNPNSIDCVITDDSMMPCFLPGDHVAGKRFLGTEIIRAVGAPCIVETIFGETLIRKVDIGEQAGYYTLISTYSSTTTNKSNMQKNIKLVSAAPILWLRRTSYKL